ncbi:MAG TPA: NifU family protein [Acidimicrobiales bacterium]|nr:NifU family protein [Acidimicrobiales bacterium]
MARSVDDLQNRTETPVVTLTDEARAVVSDALKSEAGSDRLALWLEIGGVRGAAFTYDLYFQALSDAAADDVIQLDNELPMVIPAASAARLQGARLEWSEEGDGGLVLVNPNLPTPEETAVGVPPDVLAAGLDGALALRVQAVLEESVNPSIAAHGGRADLLAMDEASGIAYLTLSGGCQGCAMSRMTLTQGIEVALKDEIAEITGIVDVTDHGGGENPYY